MSVLSVNHACFSYGQNDCVKDVSFVIEKGSYTAIVGKNGSGKSTLAKLICSLLPLKSGSVEIKEGNRIGLVFQSPKDQIVSSIVSRDTAFGPQSLGLKKSEVELRTIECLNIVDLLEKANTSSNALSLGQNQKLALSGMLAIWPEILILDEAVAMLDPETKKSVFEFLRYWHKTGNTILHITHDMDAILEADNIIGMEEGKIFFYGTTSAFMKNPEFVEKIKGPALVPYNRTGKPDEKAETVLFFDNVSFDYAATGGSEGTNKSSGVKNISFALKKGSLTALTGPSGAGKSTILELGSGLLKAEKGTVSGKSRPVLAQQNAEAALFEAFAADDVAFGPKNKGVRGKALKEIVKRSMNQAYLPFEEYGERPSGALSGGEQRRLAIAGILALDADVIFFDEPAAGLDAFARYEIMMLLKNLCEQGKTVLFSTHHPDEAAFAQREIRIENGVLVYDSDEENTDERSAETAAADSNTVPEKSALSLLEQYSGASMLNGLRSVSFGMSGASRGKKSALEKLPAALRIILFLVLFILSIAIKNIYLCLAMLILSLVYCKLSGFKFKMLLKAALKILPFLLFFTVFQLIFKSALPDEVHFTSWKWFTISPSKLIFCAASIVRTYASLACISGFFVSTPEHDLIDGLKILLKPLELIKIPVRYFILIIEIIFRFIPLLIEEASGIIKTQIIRGSFGNAKGFGKKLKGIVPLIVPLILRTIKRSEALADAITMRGFE